MAKFLTSIFGLAIGVCLLWWGHHVAYQRGWDAAKVEDAPIISAATKANKTQSQTITELRDANAAWAAIAKTQADRVAKLAAQAVKDRASILAAARPRDTAPDCLKLEALPMSTCPVRLKAIQELAP